MSNSKIDEVQKNELYDFIDKNGIVCNFEYQKASGLQSRIIQIAKAYKVNIDNPTCMYFIECCGTDMQELINEIRKLIEYVGENGTITKKDNEKKQTKTAIVVLRNLILNKEPTQKILITLYNHFKKLYLTKLALKENKDIIYSLDLKQNQTFLVNKYKTQAGYFKLEELRTILKELTDLDNKYKIGLIDLDIGFESILCAYF